MLADPNLAIGETTTRRRTRELIPGRIPDLFEGDQIVLLGQYIGEEPLEFTLRGNYRGTPRVFQFRLSLDQATTRNGFVPRLWASRKIGLLVDAIREQGGTPGVVSREAKANDKLRDARAGRRDRAALDRVRNPHRVHRIPGTRGDRLLAEGQGALRGREPVPEPSDPDPERALVGESRPEQPEPEGHRRA